MPLVRNWNIAAAVFAGIAAAFWFMSAYRDLPQIATFWVSTPIDDPFFQGLRFSARMNTWAALFSGLSAVCWGVAEAIAARR